MSWEFGRKMEHPEETHIGTGGTSKPHKEMLCQAWHVQTLDLHVTLFIKLNLCNIKLFFRLLSTFKIQTISLEEMMEGLMNVLKN